MINRTIRMTLLLLLMQSSVFILGKDQTIEVVNSSDATLTLEHGVPEYTKVLIALKKIDPLQYQLNKAIMDDSPEGIRNAINAGANIHRSRVGKAPLLVAVLCGRTKAVEELLKYGATTKFDSEFDSTLLTYAVRVGDFKSAFLLLNKACDMKNDSYLNYAKGRFQSFLREALNQCNLDSALYLLKESPRFFGKNEWITNKSTGKKEWILKDAISMARIFELFAKMAKPATGKKTWILKDAVSMARILGIMQDLLDHGYKANSIWSENVEHILYRNTAVLELFIENGADPNYNPNYPIFRALNIGNKDGIEALIDWGARLDKTVTVSCFCRRGCQNPTPLKYAINHGLSGDIVELLVSHDAKL